MNKQETRRTNPIAKVTLFLVAVLIVFEALVIFGVLELKSQNVAKIAPWAYEPFLKLMGEHPDSAPRWATVEEATEEIPAAVEETRITGLEPELIPVLMDTNETIVATNVILEASVPLEAVPEPVPVITSTNKPAATEEVVPVG